jgi:predicted dehydrogenase
MALPRVNACGRSHLVASRPPTGGACPAAIDPSLSFPRPPPDSWENRALGTLKASAHRTPRGRKLRLGVIGAGAWAVASHLPAFARRADVVEPLIINRRDSALLQSIRDRFGFAHATTRWEDVVAERPDIVLVASPAGLHHEHAAAALDAGAHVLCEKPFTVAPDDAWDLVARAKAGKRELVVAFGWNYLPMVVEAERLMTMDGGVGEIEHLSVTMASNTRALLSGTMRAVEGSLAPRPDTWTDRDLAGGGYAQAQLSHALALALRLTDLRAREVFAYLGGGGTGAIELHDAIAIRFDGGGIGTVSGASNHGSDGGRHHLELRVVGAHGELLLDLEREALRRFLRSGDDVRVPVEPGDGRYDAVGPVDAIVDLALGHGVNRSPAELGARTTEVLEAVYRSAATHAPAEIEPR